jgi:hypothetical protein
MSIQPLLPTIEDYLKGEQDGTERKYIDNITDEEVRLLSLSETLKIFAETGDYNNLTGMRYLEVPTAATEQKQYIGILACILNPGFKKKLGFPEDSNIIEVSVDIPHSYVPLGITGFQIFLINDETGQEEQSDFADQEGYCALYYTELRKTKEILYRKNIYGGVDVKGFYLPDEFRTEYEEPYSDTDRSENPVKPSIVELLEFGTIPESFDPLLAVKRALLANNPHTISLIYTE